MQRKPMSDAEIAKLLGVSRARLQFQRQQAMAKLREAILGDTELVRYVRDEIGLNARARKPTSGGTGKAD